MIPEESVLVVGCGIMGAGIAQIAALHGHRALLFDIRPGAAQNAKQEITKQLNNLVSKGRLDNAAAAAAIGRLQPLGSLREAVGAQLVIEAIQEDLEIKRSLLRALEDILDPTAILTSNTSSLSITSLAAGLKRPGNVCGFHFFNPAPLMPLVEVVTGLATEESIVQKVYEIARAWGKAPVRAKSTPGFIVNRIARPFYAEALRVLQEQAADPATLDAAIRESGGFRMGPFELMDLIGHDVNYAVTCSVHAAFFGDPKFTPSLFQRELVDAGRLGRKTGQGVYQYGPGSEQPQASTLPPGPPPSRIRMDVDLGPAASLADMAASVGMVIEQGSGRDGGLTIDGVRAVLTDGRSATVRAAQEGVPDLVTFDLARDYSTCKSILLAAAEQCHADSISRVASFFQALGKDVSPMLDVPGMIVMRTVAMLVNEAADAVLANVATPSDIDIAMVKGTNYPLGPLTWGDEIGPYWILRVLNGLQESYGEDRYRASQYLQRVVAKKGKFHA